MLIYTLEYTQAQKGQTTCKDMQSSWRELNLSVSSDGVGRHLTRCQFLKPPRNNGSLLCIMQNWVDSSLWQCGSETIRYIIVKCCPQICASLPLVAMSWRAPFLLREQKAIIEEESDSQPVFRIAVHLKRDSSGTRHSKSLHRVYAPRFPKVRLLFSFSFLKSLWHWSLGYQNAREVWNTMQHFAQAWIMHILPKFSINYPVLFLCIANLNAIWLDSC